MISLYYVESGVINGGGYLVTVPCTVRRLCVYRTSLGTALTVVFRDGGITGPVRGNITVAPALTQVIVSCEEDEVIRFDTSLFVECNGVGFAGAYLMGNPVGPISVGG